MRKDTLSDDNKLYDEGKYMSITDPFLALQEELDYSHVRGYRRIETETVIVEDVISKIKDLEKKLAEANARIVEKTLDAQSEEKWANTYKKQRDEFEKKLVISSDTLKTLEATALTDMQLILIRNCLENISE